MKPEPVVAAAVRVSVGCEVKLARGLGEEMRERGRAVEDDQRHRDEVDAEGGEGDAYGGREFHEAEAFGGALLLLDVVEWMDDVEVGVGGDGAGGEGGHGVLLSVGG